jgi:preprotein translocase SecE subunit
VVAATQQAAATGINWQANWMYVQAAAGLLAGILGAFFVFKLLNSPKFVEFQIMTESEMRKVTWPSRKAVIRSTQVIIFMTFLFAGILWVVDLGFVWFFQLIGIITKGST